MVPTPFFSEGCPTGVRQSQKLSLKEQDELDAEKAAKAVSEEEMRQLIDAMQGNFNMVCDQLREAQNFYDQAE